MRHVTVAATQMACSWSPEENIEKAENLVRSAAAQGAQIILLQELFERVYFCQEQHEAYFAFAAPVDENPAIGRLRQVAAELEVVIPVSFFEQAGQCLFNSVVVVDADGSVSEVYRKSHIPDGPGYCEKFYFSPGDTGFRVFPTRYAQIGVGICWDQWFPEAARAMVLKGAELLFYPTAIGSEPHAPDINSLAHWQRTQQGHAAANLTPVIASNRIGSEQVGQSEITFYGGSFITDEFGEKVQEAGQQETILTHTFDLDECAANRRGWGIFRDRRPELYTPVITKDGIK